jgi:hypothetical protein
MFDDGDPLAATRSSGERSGVLSDHRIGDGGEAALRQRYD